MRFDNNSMVIIYSMDELSEKFGISKIGGDLYIGIRYIHRNKTKLFGKTVRFENISSGNSLYAEVKYGGGKYLIPKEFIKCTAYNREVI